MKPGEARLLTDEELDDIGYPILPLGDRSAYRRVAKAQDAKTATIVRKQKRERIFTLLESENLNCLNAIHYIGFDNNADREIEATGWVKESFGRLQFALEELMQEE